LVVFVSNLTEFVADAVSPLGEFPLYIQMRAADAAGPAFQATFVVDRYAVAFQAVNIGRAEIQTGLSFTFLLADLSVYDFQMTFLVYLKAVQK
jgi:hypothetical protein